MPETQIIAGADSPTIRLYRFMLAQWAIRSIETRKLRVSRLVDLNDPFDCVPGVEGLRDIVLVNLFRKQLWGIQEELNQTFGLLCFSSTPSEPILWSHYAEKHTGVVLGFDIVKNALVVEAVKYPDPPQRPAIHLNELSACLADDAALMNWVHKTLTVKALQWKAESEYRALVPFACAGCVLENGDYFLPLIHTTLVLVKVILGFRCKLEENYVAQSLKAKGFKDVHVVRAKPSIDSYQVEC